MRIRVDRDLCVGHGRCYELSPEIFDEDERGHCKLKLEQVPVQHEAQAQRGAANCPEHAIFIDEN